MKYFQNKATFLLLLCSLFFTANSIAQTFTSSESLLNNAYNSGGCVGVADMNQDGYDDIVILDQSRNLFVEYQNPDGTFSDSFFQVMANQNQWGMAVGDVDNDGHLDVISGNGTANYANIDAPGVSTLTVLPEVGNSFTFSQAMSFGDINNDGWIDLYGCDDVHISNIWGNDGLGNLFNEDSWINLETEVPSDNSGNYGSVFTDYDGDGDLDLYVAKCRQGVNDPNDPRRINTMYQNDGSNNYTEVAEDIGLRPLEQSWTSDFADIDNDGDFDCLLTNHSTSLLLYENNGTGIFTDITAGSGLELFGFFLQAKFHDMDNDGFVDLIYSGGTHKYMKNNGDQTFTEVVDTFPYSNTMHSFGIGDLNHDGWLDVYSSYGNGYVSPDYNNDDKLWLNDGGTNHWVAFQLTGYESNKSAIGAKVVIHGSFGTQIREVRGGESYGISNTFLMHFGLGTETVIDYAEVFWPSGQYSYIDAPASDQYYHIHEITGCMDDTACNYDPLASIDSGLCNFDDPCSGCTDSTACNFNENASIDDGSCSYPGCSNPFACNYDSAAGCDDGSCISGGCNDPIACNYDSTALCDNGTCEYGPDNDSCANATPLSVGLNTINNEGTCILEGYSVPNTGCNNTSGWCSANAVENDVWFSFTTPPNQTVVTLETAFDGTGTLTDTQMAIWDGCGGVLIAANDDGGADQYMSFLTFGCNDLDPNTTYLVMIDGWSGDSGTAELYLTFDSTDCGAEGCTDVNACNYDVGATTDDGSCSYPGCLDSLACNYDATATCSDDSCEYTSCLGCTDSLACNFDSLATQDDGSCVSAGCMDLAACNYDSTAGCDNGSCVYPGCNDSVACNFDPAAGCDDGSCEYVSCSGCTDPTACNYDATATIDNGTCILGPCTCDGDANGDGFVDILDLVAVSSNFGCFTDCTDGDSNFDGVIDILDLIAVSSNFGVSCFD